MTREQARQLVTDCIVDAGELAEAITAVKHMTQVVTAVQIAELLLKARLHDDSPKPVKLGPDFAAALDKPKETP